MNYQLLVREWKKYLPKWDRSYNRSTDSEIWNNPLSHIEEKVQFLNDWLCRVDKKTAIPDIKKYSERFDNLLQEFSSQNLLNLTYRKSKQLKQIYNLLAEVNGLGPTGISKYLHMHKPDLFIMWDNQIFRDYFHIKTVLKSTATSTRYLKFMLRMRDDIREAIYTFALSKDVAETRAITKFRKNFNVETLPRILDKYNYVTRGQPKQPIY
jgi:hypothetical protein